MIAEGGGEWGGGGWFSEMSLSYEARVAVRGELASPKSLPKLLLNNMDDRDTRETHPTVAHMGTKKSYCHQRASFLRTIGVLFLNAPIYFLQQFCEPGNAQHT